MLAGFHSQFFFMFFDFFRDRHDAAAGFFQLGDDFRRQRFFEQLAGTAHGTKTGRFFCGPFFNAGLGGDADAGAETVTAQDAHGAAVAVFVTVERHG